jgi:hypothetical protein
MPTAIGRSAEVKQEAVYISQLESDRLEVIATSAPLYFPLSRALADTIPRWRK